MSRKTKRPLPSNNSRLTRRTDGLVALALLALTLLAFANALSGDFVYDDTRQITQNILIQDPQYTSQALLSDVWAFKDNAAQAVSNYWRPVFVAWLIFNERLFGVADPFPWHLTNLILHGLVTVLAYGWLRSRALARPAAFGIAALFAVHPAHVESVTWISGSPDVLMALPLVGALWLTQRAVLTAPRSRQVGWILLAMLCAALALLAKEAAIVLPLLILSMVWVSTPSQSAQARVQRALLWAAPFVVVAGVYFAARWQILGQVARTNYGHTGPSEIFLTAPALLLFYLRQVFFPLWLGPNYPLRPVTLTTLAFENFFGPTLLVIGLIIAVVWLARRGLRPMQQLGLALFLWPLAPAFNILAFIPEHIAHDRYLYLPLLGLLMCLWPMLLDVLNARFKNLSASRLSVIVALLACIPLLIQTWRYNPAWRTEFALWERAIESDPTSAFNWSLYAQQLYKAGRIPDAKMALDRALVSLAVSSAPDSLILRADIAVDEQRYADAIADLTLVIQNQNTNVAAYERLAVAYQQQGDLTAAAQVLLRARELNPASDCELTTNLAVLYYLSNAKAEAQAELERVRPFTAQDFSPICRQALFYLGELYTEQGRTVEARTLYADYVQLTATFTDATTLRYQQLAQQRLGQ